MSSFNYGAFGGTGGFGRDGVDPNDLSYSQSGFDSFAGGDSGNGGSGFIVDEDLMAGLDAPLDNMGGAEDHGAMHGGFAVKPEETMSMSYDAAGNGGSFHMPNAFNGADPRSPYFNGSVANTMAGSPFSINQGVHAGSITSPHQPAKFMSSSYNPSTTVDMKASLGNNANFFNSPVSPSAKWGTSSPAAPFGSSLPAMLNRIDEVPKLLGKSADPSTQELKKKRRRESHNLVERRRRDHINDRIQDLCRLVPPHRLEGEKSRKPGAPGSPTQSVSGLAAARRPPGSSAGNITTGLPIEEKDRAPNKGDILNNAVLWTRDLMWLLSVKIQQQEELMSTIAELGGRFPFDITEDERRMQTELMEVITRDGPPASYSRSSSAPYDGNSVDTPMF